MRTVTMIVWAIGVLWAATVTAQEKAILVLDGSGSMWGQIDGQHKIVIAREVIAQVLDDIPPQRSLGLVAYGHNRKGDCGDIEQVAPVGAARSVIRDAVNRINPKGKTPITDAVVFAAEKLRYEEQSATVILVSDGIENCAVDPCEVARALQSSGVDFTVHVVGFDVYDPETLAQLQCIADETGGKFYSAANADELTNALNATVAAAPSPSSSSALLNARATQPGGDDMSESGLNWRIAKAGGGPVVFESSVDGALQTALPPGRYDIFIDRTPGGPVVSTLSVKLRPGANPPVTIPLASVDVASLQLSPATAVAVHSDLTVHWQGPNRRGDYVTIVEQGTVQDSPSARRYTDQGQPLILTTPLEAGDYEVRYMSGKPAKVLFRVPISIIDVQATLQAPAVVAAGAGFDVIWQGPAAEGDRITIAAPSATQLSYDNTADSRANPVQLIAPLDEGEYELRYLLAGKRIIGRTPIRVEAVTATVAGPDTAYIGGEIEVAWTGPAEPRDYVTITRAGAPDRSYNSYFFPAQSDANGRLAMPLETGNYELRYVQGGVNVIARAPIKLTAVSATLSAPSSAPASTKILVEWSGPDTFGDYVILSKNGKDVNSTGGYFFTSSGSPGELILPAEPGRYSIRYLQLGDSELASIDIEVRAVSATLDSQ